jgi:hypothetical protein
VKIDIDALTEAELVDLNHRIVERLRFLSQVRAHGHMLQFKIGDRVSFQAEGRPIVVGMLTRYNRRTVTSSPTLASAGMSRRHCCAGRTARPQRKPQART